MTLRRKPMRLLRFLNKLSVILAAYVVVVAVWQIPYAWAVALSLTMWLLSKRGGQLWSYGTAAWATVAQLRERGMLDANGTGLIIGQVQARPSYGEGVQALFNRRLAARDAVTEFQQSCQGRLIPKPRHLVRLNSSVHTMVAAPTGVGKGRSVIVPFLLTSHDPCVVIDIKGGENAKKTAYARERMGHRVELMDPYKVVTQRPATYNPMGLIDPDSPTAIDECRGLAEAIVVRTGRESDPYWNDAAEIWIGSMMCAMVAFAPPHQRNLQSVRAQLADAEKRNATIEMMCKSPQWGGMLSRFGHSLKNFQGKTLDTVLTATNQHLRWADSIAIAESTSQSSFNPADLLKGRMTVYLILPTEHIRTQSALLRLWISSMLRVCIKGGLQT
jgi:type IV secretion system protein VirD4